MSVERRRYVIVGLVVDLRINIPDPRGSCLPVSWRALVHIGDRDHKQTRLENVVEHGPPHEGPCGDECRRSIRTAVLEDIKEALGRWLERECAAIIEEEPLDKP